MKLKKFLSILLSLALLCSLLPMAALADLAEEMEESEAALVAYLSEVKAGLAEAEQVSVSDWAELKTALEEGAYAVMANDIAAPAGAETVIVPVDVFSMLDLNGHTLDGSEAMSDKNDPYFRICLGVGGGTLFLDDSGAGGKITGGNYGVYVAVGAFYMMGGEITGQTFYFDDKSEPQDGLAVSVGGSPDPDDSETPTAVFLMDGGKISGGLGGVNVLAGGCCVMLGGEISEQHPYVIDDDTLGGFGMRVIGEGAIFYMLGGSIEKNLNEGLIAEDGAIVAVQSGTISANYTGISAGDSSVLLIGGEISESGDDGVLLSGASKLVMMDGKITKNAYNGVKISGESEMSMTGGEITVNKHDGVEVDGSEDETYFVMSGGEISGNEFGVHVLGGAKFAMEAGEDAETAGVICGNYYNGVYLEDFAAFMLDEGEILENGLMGQPELLKYLDDGTLEDELGENGLEVGENGVYVKESTFIMTGGRIGRSGHDGVYVPNGAFAMTGGEISENVEDGVDFDDGEFTMTGGEIIKNADDGVHMSGGAFTMSGGRIGQNWYDGVYLKAGEFAMTGGEISENKEDGVVVWDGAFTMNGGEIGENKEDGVILNGGAFTMNGGEISENGDCGVEIWDGEFEMTVLPGGDDFGRIIKNGYYGVLIAGYDADFTMYDGEIADNGEAGVYFSWGSAAVAGGKITGNGVFGIYVEYGNELCLSGELEISGNEQADIFLEQLDYDGDEDMAYICLEDKLLTTRPISVAVECPPEDENASVPITSGLPTHAQLNQFVSAVPAYYIAEAEDGEAVLRQVASASEWQDIVDALAAGEGVKLETHIAAAADDAPLAVPKGKSATLDLNGFTLDGSALGSMGFAVQLEGSLTLADSSDSGTGELLVEDPELAGFLFGVHIDETGALVLTGGAIRDPYVGVAVEGGDFIMSGGVVCDAAAGVIVTGGGSFLMSAGVVENCGFGVTVSGASSIFQMDGEYALVQGNEVVGVAVGADGEFDMWSGEISNNGAESAWLGDQGRADGVSVDGGCFRMYGGHIYDNYENGVYVDGEDGAFLMGGGRISGHEGHYEAEDDLWYGGVGVLMRNGFFGMADGMICENNGGVQALGGVFEMDGGEINDSHGGAAPDGYVFGGCAVWIEDAEVYIYDGCFSGNRYGILSYGDAAVELSGALRFKDSEISDLILFDGNVVTVGGALELEAPISVETKPLPAAGRSVVLTSGLPGSGGADSFVSAKAGYTVKLNSAGEAILAKKEIEPDYDGGGETTPEKKTDETKPGAEETVSFTDVAADAWYASAADFAAETGLFEGVVAEGAEVAFEPEAEMNRGEAIRVLWNLAGKPAPEGTGSFGDVPADSFFDEAVAWALETGVTNGTGEGFDPDGPITREQFATMVYRFLQASGKGFEGLWAFPLDFTDASEVSDWAREGMSWLVMNGVINGMGDGTLNPQGVLTRAQTAALLQRVADLLEAES